MLQFRYSLSCTFSPVCFLASVLLVFIRGFSVFLLFYFILHNLFRSFYFFFFSSRRRHTRCLSDWSSDVCSSDLRWRRVVRDTGIRAGRCKTGAACSTGTVSVPVAEIYSQQANPAFEAALAARTARSEERRVGKECRARWVPYHEKTQDAREQRIE